MLQKFLIVSALTLSQLSILVNSQHWSRGWAPAGKRKRSQNVEVTPRTNTVHFGGSQHNSNALNSLYNRYNTMVFEDRVKSWLKNQALGRKYASLYNLNLDKRDLEGGNYLLSDFGDQILEDGFKEPSLLEIDPGYRGQAKRNMEDKNQLWKREFVRSNKAASPDSETPESETTPSNSESPSVPNSDDIESKRGGKAQSTQSDFAQALLNEHKNFRSKYGSSKSLPNLDAIVAYNRMMEKRSRGYQNNAEYLEALNRVTKLLRSNNQLE